MGMFKHSKRKRWTKTGKRFMFCLTLDTERRPYTCNKIHWKYFYKTLLLSGGIYLQSGDKKDSYANITTLHQLRVFKKRVEGGVF